MKNKRKGMKEFALPFIVEPADASDNLNTDLNLKNQLQVASSSSSLKHISSLNKEKQISPHSSSYVFSNGACPVEHVSKN